MAGPYPIAQSDRARQDDGIHVLPVFKKHSYAPVAAAKFPKTVVNPSMINGCLNFSMTVLDPSSKLSKGTLVASDVDVGACECLCLMIADKVK